MRDIFNLAPSLIVGLELPDDPHRLAILGMGRHGDIGRFSDPDFSNNTLILFGLISSICWA